MKQILLLSLLSFLQFMSQYCYSQINNVDIIATKLSTINDSITSLFQAQKYDYAITFCEKGLNLLYENGYYLTPAYAKLCLQAGNVSISRKDYYKAKYYYFQSFILDEVGTLGLNVYDQIEHQAIQDKNLYYFHELISIAKSDTLYKNKLFQKPNEVANDMNDIAWKKFNQGKYNDAMLYFEYELNLLDAIGQTGDDNYLSIIQCQILCLSSLEKLDIAYQTCDYLIKLVNLYYNDRSIHYADALKTKASIASALNNIDEAILLYNKALEIYEFYKGKANMDYIRCLRSMASTYMNTKYILKNIEIEEQAKLLLDKAPNATLSDKSANASSLSHSYGLTGNVVKQLEYAKMAQKYLEKDGQTNTIEYAFTLNTVCSALYATNKYQEAINLGKKCIDILKSKACTPTDSIMLRMSISNLSSSYLEIGNTNKAITILSNLLSSNDYPDTNYKLSDIQKLVMFYQRAGNTRKEKEACEKLLELAQKLGGKNSELYANALIYSAFVQEKTGDTMLQIQEAIKIYQTLGIESDGYLQALQALSFIDVNNEVYDNSQNILLQLLESSFGKKSFRFYQSYLKYLYTQSEKMYEYGMKERLIKLQETCETILQQINNEFGKEQELYIYAEQLLSNIYKNLFNLQYDRVYIDKSIYFLNDIVKYNKIIYGENNIKYIHSLEELANAKIQYFEYYDDAYKIQKQIVKFYERNYGKQHEYYANAICRLGQFYFHEINYLPLSFENKFNDSKNIKDNLSRKLQEAINLTKEALDIYLKTGNNISSTLLMYLSWMYNRKNDFLKASECLNRSFKIWKKDNINQLSMLTSFEKNQKINSWNWISMIEQYTSEAIYNNIPLYNEIAYNAQLFNKGILLDSEIGFKETISKMNDNESLDLINQMNDIQSKIQHNDSTVDNGILNIKYQNLERILMKKSQEYGDYMHNLNISFNDVKSALKPSDIAIEFITTRSYINGKICLNYYALTIASDYLSPHLIKICTDEDLETNDSLYSIVWKPLENEIKNKKNIYFAPTQKLHIKPLESAAEIEGFLNSINKSFYRLTSTRQLAYRRKKQLSTGAVIYGALQYSTDLKALEADSKKYKYKNRSFNEELLTIENLNLRGKIWNYLPGTLKEVEGITSIIRNANIPIYLYTDTIGTEASFKNLNGTKRKFIHIATHGFYYTKKDSTKMRIAGLDIMRNRTDSRYFEDKSLLRSGLLFTGCNNVLTGTQLPNGIEDGVLFAQEIANLDLKGLDLLTLSACETGLGDISGEGVFGLQRAFKKAGAQSILMSLWEVDDYATSLLMIHFYQSFFIKGMTKTESLKKAQQYIKSLPGYESPLYWAGFVLLDALN